MHLDRLTTDELEKAKRGLKRLRRVFGAVGLYAPLATVLVALWAPRPVRVLVSGALVTGYASAVDYVAGDLQEQIYEHEHE